MATKKEKAFALFSKNFTPQDPEVKKAIPDYKCRHKLYEMWKESHSVFKVDTPKECVFRSKSAGVPEQTGHHSGRNRPPRG
jgi:hypothetical protein